LNKDGTVDVTDQLIVLGAWGPCVPGEACPGDTNDDLSVDVTDLLQVLGDWCSEDCFPTGEGVTIGIIDTGVDYTHPDLGGCFGNDCKVIDGYDFVNNDNDPMDDHGHGTHVAATAAGSGVLKGVAPDANLVAYKVLDAGGSGYLSNVIAAIERAVDPNEDGNFDDQYDIISLSLGYSGGNPDSPDAKAIDNAVDAGIIAVIAAGNFGSRFETIGCPGCAEKAITVGATDKQDNFARFSSRGPVEWKDEEGNLKIILKPEIVAPGVDICAAQS
ncbi:MAG: S8 family serine peptidase, partial [Acidobacteria bacterium]|nr:S8 family serine peptidase [Acidobacteriota bacterium]